MAAGTAGVPAGVAGDAASQTSLMVYHCLSFLICIEAIFAVAEVYMLVDLLEHDWQCGGHFAVLHVTTCFTTALQGASRR